ncbi:glycosyltransferase family 4 protein [Flavobacterium sp.]|uniref:glycosyltransferase family 4 protein n=1 Tax=Flavobacterium sp. TaxID=239 RepID=UPI002635AB72|nr:glycosyltransferase family 4 protein [Flavobacterium sp.]
MRVIAVHLLNDYSGSPKVLMQLLKGWTKNNIETHLFTCSGRDGFLSDIPKVSNHFYWYQFAKNPFIRLGFLSISQIILAFKLFFFLKKTDVLYVNTVLPFGAGIIGKIKGCKVIYHIHETSMKPKILKKFLFGIVSWSATEVVYVSNFLANKEPTKNKKSVLYNVLEKSFVEQANLSFTTEKTEKIVLMICSLKAYKGVNEFLKLALLNSKFTFKLVVNASQTEIDNYFKNDIIPTNLLVYPTQKDTHLFYKEASVLVNLSDINLWVETFGLTVLEGMAYGLPAIVPPIGGVVELVDEGKNGFLIDSKKYTLISEKLNTILSNPSLYNAISKNAIEKSQFFGEDYFENESIRILSN